MCYIPRKYLRLPSIGLRRGRHRKCLPEVSGEQNSCTPHKTAVLSRASTAPLWDMVLSSNTINLQSRRTIAISLCFEMSFNGSLKVEWAVLPPSNSVAAIPYKVTATAIFLTDLTSVSSQFRKKFFPVPLGASRKNNLPVLEVIDVFTFSYIFFWSSFSFLTFVFTV
jgi:hypothetical protein